MNDFRKLADKHVGNVDEYRFVLGAKQLDLKDETRFSALKHLIVNGATIFVLQSDKHVGNVDEYRFVLGAKQLDLKDETRFSALKHLIVNGATIFVLQCMQGGSDWMEIPKLIEKIRQ
ncbi:unnamed protein product [Rotaria magnacalcarata]|uniref:Uncharacterized protein n=1 Tax=Rotaria magnacalcarata TaxID=392030 RepID=A0A816G3Q9_9BILA|nr:unnamed protein product [Rotaria magnacalcarata]